MFLQVLSVPFGILLFLLPSLPPLAIPIPILTAVGDLSTSIRCVASSIDSYPEFEGIQDKLLRGWS